MILSQIFAVAIFLIMLGVIISDKVPRYLPALIGAALAMVAGMEGGGDFSGATCL